MAITVCPVTEGFAAEIGDVDLSRPLDPADVASIKQAFWDYAVLVFPGQELTDEQHIDFARHFGPLETTIAALNLGAKLRVPDKLADVSNLNSRSEIWGEKSRTRMLQLANRLWHTDSSFKRLPAYCSMLYAPLDPADRRPHRVRRPARRLRRAARGDCKRRLAGLVAEHSLMTSRAQLGFSDFDETERKAFAPVPQVLVRRLQDYGRMSPLPREPRRRDPRHAEGRGRGAHRGADRARHAAPVRLHPSLARATTW